MYQFPNELKSKKCIVKMESEDDGMTFYDSIHCAHSLPQDNKRRPLNILPKDSPFIWEDHFFICSKEDIKKFEQNNPTYLVKVWEYVDKIKKGYTTHWKRFYHNRDFFQLKKNCKKIFYLFLYKNRFNPIIMLQAFYRVRFNPVSRKDLYVCFYCDLQYDTEDELNYHESHCREFGWEYQPQTKMPTDFVLKFINHSRTLRHPFVLYIDSESFLEKILKKKGASTFQIQHHQTSTWGTLFIDHVKNELEYNTFHSVKKLFTYIKSKLEYISSLDLAINKRSKEKTSLCSYCQLPFTKKNPAVEDHCHFSGESRGFVHNECNLNRKDTWFLPIIAHNMMGYDSHFLIPYLKSINNTERLQKRDGINIIGPNLQNFIYFEARYQGKSGKTVRAKFIDSLKFLDASLDNLSKNLTEFKYSSHFFKNKNIFKRKGFFPYSFVTSEKILDETTQLPPKDAFYDDLHDKPISDEDYQFSQQMWNEFKCQTLRDYMERYYLKLDVTLLADVFENYRDFNLQTHSIDPIYYVSGSALTMDNGLKNYNQKLELLSDSEMYEFFENNKRGGYVGAHMRHAKKDASTHILYQDMRNLYGWAECEPLPISDFRWDYDNLDFLEDCYVECDISLPKHLFDYFKDFPLFPEKIDGRLMATLYPKKYYGVHSRYLKLGLSLGYQLDKVHRILRFKSFPWLKDYIEKNTELRKEATKKGNKFEKDLLKFMNNSMFGKQIQDVRKEKEIHFTSKENYIKSVSSERFNGSINLDENYLVQMKKKQVVLNKPIYGGVTILDLSKMHMADYYYNCLKKCFGNRVKLIYTDTDSFILWIQSENPYKELEPYFEQWIDTFSIPHYPDQNWMVPGKIADEMGKEIITEIVAPREKQYAYKTLNETKKKSKGHTKTSLNEITFRDFKDAVFGNLEKPIKTKMNIIRSRDHQIYTETVNKIVFSVEEPKITKRQICENKVDTLPWGYSD